MMDWYARRGWRGAPPGSPTGEKYACRDGIMAAPSLAGRVVQQMERAGIQPNLKGWRTRLFKLRRAASIPYLSQARSFELHADQWEWKQEDGRYFVRVKLWRVANGKLPAEKAVSGEALAVNRERNAKWYEVYPMGDHNVSRLAVAAANGGLRSQAELVWQPKAKNYKRRWRLIVRVNEPAHDVRAGQLAAGIDFGEKVLAAVGVPGLHKRRIFNPPGMVTRVKVYHGRLRALQPYGVNAMRTVREKETNWRRNIINTTVRAIVDWLKQFPEVGIVRVEDLRDIREGADKRSLGAERAFLLSRFPYGMFQERLRQVAEQEGFCVEVVPAAYTSQNCSHCGARGLRNGSNFKCPTCGYGLKTHVHADLNAADNIALTEPTAAAKREAA
jgi:IS605 OrfB family transposase